MNSSSLHRYAVGVVVATIILLTFDLRAQVPSQDVDRVATREQIMARMQKLPDSSLKRFYLYCSHAVRHSLGTVGVAVCSIGYEVLLKRTFGGDFDALLAWSRLHPDDDFSALEDGEVPFRIP